MKTSVRGKTMTIDDDVCWMCGKPFDNAHVRTRKTYHHTIPVRYRPLLNVKLPLCQDCHYRENEESTMYKRYYYALKAFFEGTQRRIALREQRKREARAA